MVIGEFILSLLEGALAYVDISGLVGRTKAAQRKSERERRAGSPNPVAHESGEYSDIDESRVRIPKQLPKKRPRYLK